MHLLMQSRQLEDTCSCLFYHVFSTFIFSSGGLGQGGPPEASKRGPPYPSPPVKETTPRAASEILLKQELHLIRNLF